MLVHLARPRRTFAYRPDAIQRSVYSTREAGSLGMACISYLSAYAYALKFTAIVELFVTGRVHTYHNDTLHLLDLDFKIHTFLSRGDVV